MFEIRARPVQILTPPFTTLKQMYLTGGIVLKPDASGPDSSIVSATISVNDASRAIAVTNGTFRDSTALAEGVNLIVVSTATGRDSVTVTRRVRHTPTARVTAEENGGTVILDARGTTDPDGQQVTDFAWLDDPAFPLGLAGRTGVSVSFPTPEAEGEYYFGLIARDPDGNADTTRSYFVITADDSLVQAAIARNPAWARDARVYFLFPKAASPAGTINAAAARLPLIRDLGFSVIWMMPVMKNAYPIDNGVGPGYNIVDFRTVAPEYGTNQDFKNFVAQAHSLGMKVILDVTPNHTSRFHPWADNARTLRELSPYWNWYQHSIIPHNDNGLGQSLDASGFNYYSGFSDQLLNFNWIDEDARAEMIDVYSFWIKEFDLDGYRLDVYWGPHRRYGERHMGMPVREALKHIKPDILLLAEDDGTGAGTEQIYADFVSAQVHGGADAAYDFKLFFSNVRNFGFGNVAAVNALHANLDNGGFYPGPNALYMRFMESQDEDRIFYTDPSPSTYFDADTSTAFVKTMPMASILFTAPGFPMVWNGQEVGWGYGIAGSKLARNRSVINWDFFGKDILQPHYQKLAHIRGQFRAFTQHRRDTNADGFVNASDVPDFVRVPSTNGLVYAFTRPWADQNGLTVVNLSGGVQAATLDLSGQNILQFSDGLQQGATYYLNNLYDVRSAEITGAGLAQLDVTLSPYGTAIYTVSLTRDTVRIVTSVVLPDAGTGLPEQAMLHQNYPNPFNPHTTIRFEIPEPGVVVVRVFDLLGRMVAGIADGGYSAGAHEVRWDGRTAPGAPAGSGVYFLRMEFAPASGGRTVVQVRSMVLLK
jgi:glycosidase